MRPVLWFRFFVCALLGGLSIWAGLAVWIAAAPLSVLNADHATLLASSALLGRCDPAQVVVFGDSRALFGIDPRAVNVPLLDLAQGNASPVVDYYRLRTRLACPYKPDLVILTYILPEYVRLTGHGLWTNAAYLHTLAFSERQEIIAAIHAAHDQSIFRPETAESPILFPDLPIGLKNLLYQLYFPPFYGPVILDAQKAGWRSRLELNQRVYNSILAANGHLDRRMEPRWPTAGRDVGMTRDFPDPVIDSYVQRMLALLAEHKIPSVLVVMPVNDATYSGIRVQVREGLMRYLRSLTEHYPLTHLADRELPHWPDRFFGDDDIHMNAAGTAAIAAILNACLPAELARSETTGARACSFIKPAQ